MGDKMALSTRLALRYCLSSQNGGMRWIHSTAALPNMKSVSPQEHQMLKEQFWDKNKRLNRPMSPHLTIYKPQMTSMLSITHRGTGLAQSGLLYLYGFAAVLYSGNHATLLADMNATMSGAAFIFLVKYGISWAVSYHLLNGIRHLAWDMGYGFEMADLYKTGKIVMALSVLCGVLVASL